ncbi:MAG: 16S rRNA (uracil(1498)-N(3))-methyltransferase [Bacteroidetes bacterium]|nr:16S rRNA (uracil(1498)-N(3))-methyltransferase [Bacteroidota bacterium]MBS1649001.1 16S rRNA (uracil(1498)-N(3))-methyltransferase [Bacteroidota bacterium]
MQQSYFYEPTIKNISPFILSEETSKHCIQVLRIKEGEFINLTDGKGNLFTAQIKQADKKHCVVNILSNQYNPTQKRVISLAVSLTKNNSRFEWLLEKATEIGVSEIIPLLCKRTEKQHFRFERMNNILIAAILQSKQTWLPILHNPTTFQATVQSSSYQQKLIAHCIENEKTSITDLPLSNNIQILIGPEGDFTEEEIQLAQKHNYLSVTLGNTRLRTETAGMVAATLLLNC